MTSEPWEHPDARKFLRRAFKELLPKLQTSSVVFSLVPRGPADIKYAVELGLSIMLDKPIILVVSPGARVPAKLAKVADEILEGDITDPVGQNSLKDRITEAAKRYKNGEH